MGQGASTVSVCPGFGGRVLRQGGPGAPCVCVYVGGQLQRAAPGPADSSSAASGARCEANTFDGERCLYGAQSDTIRRALRDYRQVAASFRRRDLYYSFLLR